jgi:hypothetical protein
MISLPDNIAPNDMSQWLDVGWFFFNHEGGFVPAIMAHYPSSPSGPYTVTLADGTNVISSDRSLIKPHWPVCGAVNVLSNKIAVYLERLQKKQFCRTYNHRMVKMHVPGKILHNRDILDMMHPGGSEVATSAFNPTYFSLWDSLENRFKNGWSSCAISPMVIVVRGRPVHMIYFRGELCGNLRNRTVEDVDPQLIPTLAKHFNGEALFP